MMPNKKMEIKVGIFMLIGILLLAVSVVMLGGDKILFASYYKIYSKFDQVQGLQNGSVVSLDGIPVGNVSKIDFIASEGKIIVQLTISKQYRDLITISTEASIRTQGALGDKYVYLSAGKAGEAPLESGALVKVSDEGDFLSALAQNSEGVNHVFDLIRELRDLTASLNANNNPSKILNNVASASQNLDGLLHDIRDESKLRQAVFHLESILAKLDRGEGTLGALINDPTVHNQIKNFLGGSQRSQYIKGMLRKTIEDQ